MRLTSTVASDWDPALSLSRLSNPQRVLQGIESLKNKLESEPDITQSYKRIEYVALNEVSTEKFAENYLAANRPVVLQGAASSWPAASHRGFTFAPRCCIRVPG